LYRWPFAALREDRADRSKESRAASKFLTTSSTIGENP